MRVLVLAMTIITGAGFLYMAYSKIWRLEKLVNWLIQKEEFDAA